MSKEITELETLKDMPHNGAISDYERNWSYEYGSLKDAAKKWISYLENEFVTERPKELNAVYKNKAAYQIQWIKHFFNLEELK